MKPKFAKEIVGDDWMGKVPNAIGKIYYDALREKPILRWWQIIRMIIEAIEEQGYDVKITKKG